MSEERDIIINGVVMTEHVEMSPQIGELVKALALSTPGFGEVKRSKLVDYTTKAGKRVNYAYAPYPEITAACNPSINKNGLVFMALPCAAGYVAGMLAHSSGQWIKATISIPRGDRHDAQGEGSLQTYSKKYLYCAILNLPFEDDDGLKASDKSDNKKPAATPKQKSAFETIAEWSGLSEKIIRAELEKHNVTTNEELAKFTRPAAEAVINLYKKENK